MPVLLAAHHRLARDPIELNHPSGPRERLMPVPRIITTPECEQRPARRGHFKDHVFEVSGGTQHPEPATRGLPRAGHANAGCDALRLGINVNLAIVLAAA